MYQLQIWGPKGRRVLRWDPRKLQERDPKTLATFAEADRLMKEAFAQGEIARQSNAPLLHLAASGRWIES
jgi:hypothetical protein